MKTILHMLLPYLWRAWWRGWPCTSTDPHGLMSHSPPWGCSGPGHWPCWCPGDSWDLTQSRSTGLLLSDVTRCHHHHHLTWGSVPWAVIQTLATRVTVKAQCHPWGHAEAGLGDHAGTFLNGVKYYVNRIRRREKLALAQNMSFRFKLSRAKFGTCTMH